VIILSNLALFRSSSFCFQSYTLSRNSLLLLCGPGVRPGVLGRAHSGHMPKLGGRIVYRIDAGYENEWVGHSVIPNFAYPAPPYGVTTPPYGQ
jgi:hypothetical protein